MEQPPKRSVGWLIAVLAIAGVVAYSAARVTVPGGPPHAAAPASTDAAPPTQYVPPSNPAGTDSVAQADAPADKTSGLSNDDHYTNVDGDQVHSPAYSADGSAPAGASAQCADGTYSFSAHRQGTCSHHGGVASWL